MIAEHEGKRKRAGGPDRRDDFIDGRIERQQEDSRGSERGKEGGNQKRFVRGVKKHLAIYWRRR